MRPDYQEYFMAIALVVATRSTCLRRNVGAVLVDWQNRILSTGYNGVARGEPHCSTDTPCPGAYLKSGTGLEVCEAIHAEQNALLQCKNIDAINALYCTTAPCPHCTKMLMNTGCTAIYFLEDYLNSGQILWASDRSRKWVKLEYTDVVRAFRFRGLPAFVGGSPDLDRLRDEGSELTGGRPR